MRILHYLCGIPPVRGGGMIKYALDLMEAQGHMDEIFLLIPGRISFCPRNRKKIAIQHSGSWKHVPLYRIKNPLPVPMANGIRDVAWFTQKCDMGVYIRFMEELRPDVFHVHTLMGLHLECLLAAKNLGIKIVFTTHDYFGICPKTDLVCGGQNCEKPGIHCGKCCQYAFSTKRLLLEQSTLYRFYRHQGFLKTILQSKYLKRSMTSLRSCQPHIAEENGRQKGETGDYQVLLGYYRKAFDLVDYYFFNSLLTREVYERHLGKRSGEVISISNASVADRREERSINGKQIHIGYFGGDAPYKGYGLLVGAAEELYTEGINNFSLEIYGVREGRDFPFCHYHDAYQPADLGKVFATIDLLAVPSQWQETFGMVVLEALSYGVPVLVTEKVGAKDLLRGVNGFLGIIVPDDKEELRKTLKSLCLAPKLIEQMNRNIMGVEMRFDFAKHVEDIRKRYNKHEEERR